MNKQELMNMVSSFDFEVPIKKNKIKSAILTIYRGENGKEVKHSTKII